MLPRLYAFDVDDTLDVSRGPVVTESLRALRDEGHIVGLCGNWAMFVRAIPDWHRVVSFLGPFDVSKAEFLIQLRTYVPASDFIMVGNDPLTGRGLSQDRAAVARRVKVPAEGLHNSRTANEP